MSKYDNVYFAIYIIAIQFGCHAAAQIGTDPVHSSSSLSIVYISRCLYLNYIITVLERC